MGKGGQVAQAQNITQQQIDQSRQQQQMFNDLLKSSLGQRDTALGGLFPQLQQMLGQYNQNAGSTYGSAQGGLDTANKALTNAYGTYGAAQGGVGTQQDILSRAIAAAQQGTDSFKPLVSQAQQYANEGLTPAAQAALRSNSMSVIPDQFNAANSTLSTALARRGLFGGDTPASGEAGRVLAPLYAARSNAMAGANRDTILQTEQARSAGLTALAGALGQQQGALTSGQQGIQSAGSGVNSALQTLLGAQGGIQSGVGGTQNALQSLLAALSAQGQGQGMGQGLAQTIGNFYNPSSYISGSSAALGDAGSATNTRAGLIKPGFMDYAAPVIGAGLSTAGNIWCWIAEEIWGVNDVRTHFLRLWLRENFSKTAIGSVFTRLYARFGERVAEMVHRSKIVRAIATVVFESLLKRAVAERIA
jgi:hypothetical protein